MKLLVALIMSFRCCASAPNEKINEIGIWEHRPALTVNNTFLVASYVESQIYYFTWKFYIIIK